MHWKLPFLICEQRCHGSGKERQTEWEREEKRGGGLRGRCWTTMTHRDGRAEVPLLPCSLVVSAQRISLFTVPLGDPPARTHISQTHASKVVTHPNPSRCRGPARSRHVFALHRMFQPVINYDLAWQRPVLGEFLCLCGVQLIVFFLPVRSKVRAEQRPNGVLGRMPARLILWAFAAGSVA